MIEVLFFFIVDDDDDDDRVCVSLIKFLFFRVLFFYSLFIDISVCLIVNYRDCVYGHPRHRSHRSHRVVIVYRLFIVVSSRSYISMVNG